MNEEYNEGDFIETVLPVDLYTDNKHERMFFDFTQSLYKRDIISRVHCCCMQYHFLLNGYDWIDKRDRKNTN